MVVDCILDTNNSSAGPDGIPFRAYRSFATLIAPVFLSIFEDMSAGGLPPQGFNYAYLYLLPKRLTGLIEHTRPISVTNTDNRVLAKCLVFVILPVIQERLHKAQKGSIAGRQGADHIREITEQFYEAAETSSAKSNFFAFFIDTRKAFDSVRHNFIYAALRHMGLPEWVVNIVRAMLHLIAVTPVFGSSTGIWIAITRGVKQGCPTSPVIFAICLNVLIIRLAGVTGIVVWAYVDDMALGARKVRVFAVCMIIIDEFTDVSGLGVNRDKTRIVAARADGEGRDAESWVLSKQCPWRSKGVQCAKIYVYLGLLLGRGVTVGDVWRCVVLKALDRAGWQSTAPPSGHYRLIGVLIYLTSLSTLYFLILPLFTVSPISGSSRTTRLKKLFAQPSFHLVIQVLNMLIT